MGAKRWRIGFGLVAIFAITVAVWLLVPAKEGAQPYDGDLKPERRVSSKQPDGLALLQRVLDAQKVPRGAESEEKSVAENRSAASPFAGNHELVKRWEELIAAGALQVPEPRQFIQNLDAFGEWKALANLAAGDAAQQARAGRVEEGMNRALEVVQFGQMIEEGGGPMIQYLVGLGVKTIGLERVRQIGVESALTAEQSRRVIEELEKFRASGAGLSNTFKVEYQLTMREFEKLRSGQALGTNSPFEAMSGRYTLKATFDLAKTRQLMADSARGVLSNIPKPMAEMQFADIKYLRPNPSIVKLYLGGNGVGEVLVGMSIPMWTNALVKKCAENVRVAGTQAVLAIKSFQREEGRLPDGLEELVPRYLPALPADDFDGQPLHYAKEKKVVYSVGQDLVDGGGVVDPKSSNGGDMVFELEVKKAGP